MKDNNDLPDKLKLNLPDAPDFYSTPPQYTVIEMIKICEAMLPYWNKKRFVDGQDNVEIMHEDFVLHDTDKD